MHWNTDPERPPRLQARASLGTLAVVAVIFTVAVVVGLWLT